MSTKTKIPDHMPMNMQRHLEKNPAGQPIPYFVQRSPDDNKNPDFRIMDGGKLFEAYQKRLCWTCGQKLGTTDHTFVAGPMCLVNHTSAEPPSHYECGLWSARACPFLVNPKKIRRDGNYAGETTESGGIMLDRNPGVTALIVVNGSRHWTPRRVPNGVIFRFGEPTKVEWLAKGRTASRSEITASFATGLFTLREIAKEDGPDAEEALAEMVEKAMEWVR